VNGDGAAALRGPVTTDALASAAGLSPSADLVDLRWFSIVVLMTPPNDSSSAKGHRDIRAVGRAMTTTVDAVPL
jgi:hypothetical protein